MSGRFDISETPIGGLWLLQRKPVGDERGWLERMFCVTDLAEVLGPRSIAQVNRTLTVAKGAVRGLHYQVPPSSETKIVSCLRGAIFDVAIDVRRGSPTFLEWHGEELSADNRRTLFVPEGFAHGFQTLVDDTEVLYFTTAAYDPPAERGIHPDDPRVCVSWPLPIAQLSERDAAHPPLGPAFEGIGA
jgi:dTDP-4-dehydrorhamnose 3,5-epimerase